MCLTCYEPQQQLLKLMNVTNNYSITTTKLINNKYLKTNLKSINLNTYRLFFRYILTVKVMFKKFVAPKPSIVGFESLCKFVLYAINNVERREEL